MANSDALETNTLAQAVLFQAFAIELLLAITENNSSQEAWLRAFIERLHNRIDGHEENYPDDDDWPEIQEIARKIVDNIGLNAIRIGRVRRSER